MPQVAKSPDEAKRKYEMKQEKKLDAAIIKANNMYEKLIKQGKVTPANRRQIKEKIARKTGVYVTSDAD
jgi:hypothetical protein